jgi:hypothetical protein
MKMISGTGYHQKKTQATITDLIFRFSVRINL